MKEILDRVEATARNYPLRFPDEILGEVEYRFDLPRGASDGDLEKARLAVGLPRLPAAFETLLRRWDGPRLFQRWVVQENDRVDEIGFFSTGFLAEFGGNAIRELDEDGLRHAVVIANGHGCDIFMEPDREEVLIQDESRGGYFLLCPTLGDFLDIVLQDGPTEIPSWVDRSLWKTT